MKKIVKVSMVLVLGCTLLSADADQMKIYGVESGKVDYKIAGSGNIMGIVTKTAGKKRIIFKDFGAKSLTEENQVQKTVVGGNTNVNKSHKLTLMDGAMLYDVDLQKKKIMRMQNPAMAMMGMMGGDKSAMERGEEMLKQMGGKKTGTDKVLGYTCDVWEAMGTKQCIYKGIPLKVESNIMGIKNIEVAIKAEFDISISSDDLALPDFPVYDVHGKQLDKSKLASMDASNQQKAQQGAKDIAALMGALAGAAKTAGVKAGEQPTKAQEQSMEDAMMASMLPMMKKKMLAEEQVLQMAKECLGKANTLKEANICEDKMDEMSGEGGDPEDKLKEWDDETKKETLGFIDQGLAGMGCIKKAETMDQMKACMSGE